jgi:metal-responsive CopG/Arc/MetJ family transcriptional regulator
MTTVKTAISLEEPLLRRVDGLAREMNISRSRLFALAVESFIEQQQTQALLEALNAAYNDKPTPDEAENFRRMRQHHRKQLNV